METIPCKDCLTYPICRNQLLSHPKKQPLTNLSIVYTVYIAYVINIEPKCSLIVDWFESIEVDLQQYKLIAQKLIKTFDIKSHRRKM